MMWVMKVTYVTDRASVNE